MKIAIHELVPILLAIIMATALAKDVFTMEKFSNLIGLSSEYEMQEPFSSEPLVMYTSFETLPSQ